VPEDAASSANAKPGDVGIGVSAIVVSYFTGPLLARSIASLKAQPEIRQIVLVDNGNVAGEVDHAIEACANGPEIVVLSGHGNIGFAAGCNRGADRASGEFLLFFNPDAIMPDGGVAQLLSDSEPLERPWMIGAKLVGPDGVEQQGSRRATLTPWRALVEAARLYNLAPRHPYFRRFNLHNDDCPEELTAAPTISGACFFLPRKDYEAIGGMDERYFLHVEDIDFCLRFTKAGGGVYFDPNVSVVHFKSSSRVSPVRVEARKTASMIRYFRTHFSDTYPAPFLWLVAAAVVVKFGILAARRAVGKTLALAGLRVRGGRKSLEKARAMSARRSGR